MPAGVVYHQKTVIVDNISRYIRELDATSLLDIGAGHPETALPLSRLVNKYHAIEHEPDSAKYLACAGLNVSCATFPYPIGGSYDIVLSSHSVPESDIADLAPFLWSAWRLTRSGGLLLIVTFKGSRGDLVDIAHELLGRTPQPSQAHETILGIYRQLGGSVRSERVNSYAEAARAEDLANFFEPWLSPHRSVQASIHDVFVKILETRYKVRSGLYVFPTQHLFLSCHKPRPRNRDDREVIAQDDLKSD